jgi:hypothetical protein
MKLAAILLMSIFALTLQAQDKASVELSNLRTAKGSTLTSLGLPKLKLKFEKPFKYVGGHTFVLYDVARAEQHFFVDADKDGNVSRLYWVQFEGYLPSNTHTYDYKSPGKVNIGGLDFFADTWARKVDPKQGRPDSDGNRAREFLLSKGYKIKSDEVMMQRLVNMVTPDNRSELMIIYLEVLTPTGYEAADLNEGGKAAAQWPEISKGLLERAQKGMKLER